MFLIACFVLGVANFAMHKAVMESGHPFVEDTKLYFGRHFGRNGSYMVEYILLLGALFFAHANSGLIFGLYAGYTLCNAMAAWMLLSRRM